MLAAASYNDRSCDDDSDQKKHSFLRRRVPHETSNQDCLVAGSRDIGTIDSRRRVNENTPAFILSRVKRQLTWNISTTAVHAMQMAYAYIQGDSEINTPA